MAQIDNSDKWVMLAERLTKRGRKKDYTLDELQKEFEAFVKYNVEHPTTSQQRTKKRKSERGAAVSADTVTRIAPMTERAFCVWLGKSKSWFPQTIANIKAKEAVTQEDLDLLDFMERLQTFFQSQLLEGAILGEYTPNLVASLLGMKNNIDVTSNDQPVTAAPVINIIEDTKTREQYAKGE